MAKNCEDGKNVYFDPRTALLLLVFVTIVAFSQDSFYVEAAVVMALSILFLCCGLRWNGLKFISIFGFLLILQYVVFPVSPKFIAGTFSILAAYTRKVFPCIMAGTLIVKTTPMRYLVLAMRKWHFPQKLIIPLSVTVRYFPAIREEIGYIRDAMKLRKVSGLAKAEAYIVPLMFSAASTAEELSAAAVTRGIENPAPKTSVIELRLRLRDYACIIGGLVFVAAAFLLQRGAG